MRQPYLLLFILLMSSILPLWGQSSSDPLPGVGARVVGLGNAFVAVRGDVWSVFRNPANMTGTSGLEVGAYYEQRFFLPDLTYGNAAAVYPLSDNQAIGLSIGTNGFNAYRENSIGIGYGITALDIISVGAKVNVATVAIPTYGNLVSFSADLGVHVQVNKAVSVGASATNVNRAGLETNLGSREFFPTVLTVGLAYQPSDKVMVVVDAQKDVDHPISFLGGIEYAANDWIYARLGVSTAPLRLSGGLGINYREFAFDFAMSRTELLGYTPHVSITYRLEPGN